MTETSNRPEEIHQHSGWLIPLAFLAVIVLLSALFLLYDLRPAPGPRIGRTADAAPVALTVASLRLTVPANYLDSPNAREGGEQGALTITALLPDMRGYSAGDAHLFNGNPPDSPLVHLQFKGGENDLDAAERMERVYRPYLAAPEGCWRSRASRCSCSRRALFSARPSSSPMDLSIASVAGAGSAADESKNRL